MAPGSEFGGEREKEKEKIEGEAGLIPIVADSDSNQGRSQVRVLGFEPRSWSKNWGGRRKQGPCRGKNGVAGEKMELQGEKWSCRANWVSNFDDFPKEEKKTQITERGEIKKSGVAGEDEGDKENRDEGEIVRTEEEDEGGRGDNGMRENGDEDDVFLVCNPEPGPGS